MPVELKELVVKATVREGETVSKNAPQHTLTQLDERKRQELIQDCVEVVMEILNEKYHR